MKLSTLHKKWLKEPAYRKEYDALEEEFALMAEVIKARQRYGLNHAQLMRRMKTTRRTMARLENGRNVSIQTLSRFAKATGHRLKISFEPVKLKKGGPGR
jgi:transcriptional regulator with XRE-family HTH domain